MDGQPITHDNWQPSGPIRLGYGPQSCKDTVELGFQWDNGAASFFSPFLETQRLDSWIWCLGAIGRIRGNPILFGVT